MTNELTTFTTGIADAIREKEGGGTTKINPQDFASRIKNLATAKKVFLDIGNGDTAVLFSDGDNNKEYFVLASTDNYGGYLAFASGTDKKEFFLESKSQSRFYCMNISRYYSPLSSKWTYTVRWVTYTDDDDDYSSYGSVGLNSDSAELKLTFEDQDSGDLYLEGYLS